MTEPKRTRRGNGESSIYLGKDGKWHGRVTVGVKDDGKEDRRHVERKTRTEVVNAVRELEKQRDAGRVPKPGERWTLGKWLTHWLKEVALPSVSENTYAGYEVDVRVHLIPGLGAHRLTGPNRLQPDHLTRFYTKMQKQGSKPATAHHAHRTVRTALGEAVRRGILTENPAELAKPPRIEEEEIEPYTVEEAQRILLAAKGPNRARWVLALALGLRQGEALGLKWEDVDLDGGYLRIRKNRLRPKYEHGCGGTCGRKAGYCPARKQIRRETKATKSRAGRRTVGLPDELVKLLRKHREEQEALRATAAQLWTAKGYVFTSATGEPIVPNTDYHHWKQLLADAGVRDARLHDARHTAATVLLILGVDGRIVDAILGWEPGGAARMRARYMHVTDPMLSKVAKKVGAALWGSSAEDTT
ncbi:tyrosine-type recombinase/integrase [Cryptosporangium phraense]|uniref:Site-specific integrase n=1 Tax=Cryptosporangium phraense TaxID=2593070 RepID=A0A545AQZ0_9ACTN|nr:tyrosine-type recombinase/integrase [Cryptosporangium phraense]TQS43749.1 site-specific integrase [Cryptosporangium phraense]